MSNLLWLETKLGFVKKYFRPSWFR